MRNTKKLIRSQDIVPPTSPFVQVWVDGIKINASPCESILSVLFSVEKKSIAKNDHGKLSGAYCGMGMCHCCTVKVGNHHKVKACQTLIEPGMNIRTQYNRLFDGGLYEQK